MFMGRSGKEQEDFVPVQKMGELMAAQVLRAAARVHPAAENRYPIQSASES